METQNSPELAQYSKSSLKHLSLGIICMYPEIDREFYHKFLFMCQNLEEATYTIDEYGFTQTGMLKFDFLDRLLVLRANFKDEVNQIRDHLLPAIDGLIMHLPDQIIYRGLLRETEFVISRLKDLITIILASKHPVVFTSTIPFNSTLAEQLQFHCQTLMIPDSLVFIPYDQINYQTWHNVLKQAVVEINRT